MTVNSTSRKWGLFKTKSKQKDAETAKKTHTSKCIDLDDAYDSPTSVASDFSEEHDSEVSGKASINPGLLCKSRIMKNNAKGLSAQVFKIDEVDVNEYGYGDATHDDSGKYGYDEATPDRRIEYGYCDASPDDRSKHGYGDVSPYDRIRYGYGDATPDDRNKYGYGDATPDDRNKYGYGDASPDDRNKYGYGDASPDDRSKYGYGEAAPGDRGKYGYSETSSPRTSCKTPRRSSMKQQGRPRRASISFGAEIEVSLPGRTEPVKRRSSITFKETVVVKSITPMSALTSEPEKLWFQDDEFSRIKEKSKLIVHKVEYGETGGKKFCTRGLEKMMPSRREQVMKQKYKCWDTVLNEQELQRDEGIFDDDYMGNLCKFSSVQSQQEAAERARQDAAEIETYLRSTRKFCRRLSM